MNEDTLNVEVKHLKEDILDLIINAEVVDLTSTAPRTDAE